MFTNRAVVLVCFYTLPFAFPYTNAGTWWVNGLGLVAYTSTLLFHRAGWVQFGRWWFVLYSYVNVWLSAGITGLGVGEYLFFIILSFAVPLIMGTEKWPVFLFFLLLPFGLWCVLESFDFHVVRFVELSEAEELSLFKQNVLLCILGGYLAGFYYFTANREQNRKVAEQQDALENNLEEMRLANDRLLAQEAELRRAIDIAEQSSQAKAQFLSVMSHELRTPMNAVIGMSNILLEERPREDQVENLKVMRYSANHLMALINDILDFNKIESGKLELESVPFNLSELVASLEATIAMQAEKKGLYLQIDKEGSIPDLLIGDPTRINQVLHNLLGNALKFTAKGGITLSLGRAEDKPDDVTLAVSVADTGIGIPKEKQEKIFEQFAQARSDTARRFGGSGLGLTITKRLLELMGSDISVESEPGQGTEFFFRLKLKKFVGSPQKVTREVDAADKSLNGIRVLLVEDNPVNVIVAKKFLKRWKVTFDVAENGVEAVKMVQEMAYQMVLMDLQMPEMDGYTASCAIRDLGGSFADLPIIALTASALEDTRRKVYKAGMNAYVTKPFQPDQLQETMLEFL